MKILIRKPGYDADGNRVLLTDDFMLNKSPADKLNFTNSQSNASDIQKAQLQLESCILSIDGSTTNTGMALVRKHDGKLLALFSLSREKTGETPESPVRYKVMLKKFLEQLFAINPAITEVYYEEPFIGYAGAAKNLLMLRTSIDELKIENEPTFDYISYTEYNNLSWKSILLGKCPAGTEAQKQAVKEHFITHYPILRNISQDEYDALGLATAIYMTYRDPSLAPQKKKATPFKYEVSFHGARDNDDFFDFFNDVYKGPRKLLENGIKLVTLPANCNFDNTVYKSMGENDLILVLSFPSSSHGDIILQHKLGQLSKNYPVIYAIAYRKSRKK